MVRGHQKSHAKKWMKFTSANPLTLVIIMNAPPPISGPQHTSTAPSREENAWLTGRRRSSTISQSVADMLTREILKEGLVSGAL